MKILEVLNTVKHFFTENISKPYKIPAVEQGEKGWDVVVEVIEEKEYMVSHARDELVGVYHVHVNRDMEVVSFVRTELRGRSSVTK